MLAQPRNEFRILPQYQPLMRAVGLDAETIFRHPRIVAWRTLPDRDNCTLDAELNGQPVRLHIKRYQPAYGFTTPAEDEVKAISALVIEQIPTAPLVGWGKLIDRRSFVITADLTGYQAADKLIASGAARVEQLLDPTAD